MKRWSYSASASQ